MTGQGQFHIWRYGADVAEPFDPERLRAESEPSDVRYFCGVLCELCKLPEAAGRRFLLTWNLDRFAPRFDGAVVLLVGDERYQVPSYVERAAFVFKTGGTRPNPLRHTLRLPAAIASRALLRDARDSAVALRRGRARTRRSRGRMGELPLGTFRLVDVPLTGFEKRKTDVFFAGTIPPASRLEARPSVAARAAMGRGLRATQARLPAARFALHVGGAGSLPLDPEGYSRAMADARVALCPRGNFDETFRLFEAARSGCCVVSERLPDRWYYRGIPAVQLDDWRTLPGVLEGLLSDPSALASRGAAMRRWYDQSASEPAVARHVAGVLDAIEKPRR